jgi:site-specific recombinase XerD
MSPAMTAAVAFLARYSGGTYENYKYHLGCWFAWREERGLDPLNDVKRMHVELYIRDLIGLGYAAGDRTSGPLIATLDGRRCHRHTAASLVKVAAKRAGFPPDRVHPHLLRAAAITLGLDSGMSLREVQDFARHEDPRTTRKHYDLNKNDFGTHAAHTIGARLAV